MDRRPSKNETVPVSFKVLTASSRTFATGSSYATVIVGARKGMALDRGKWEKLLDEYYEIHGWDSEGRPTPQTLKRLGLDREPTHVL